MILVSWFPEYIDIIVYCYVAVDHQIQIDFTNVFNCNDVACSQTKLL